jgi:hypothetical protein
LSHVLVGRGKCGSVTSDRLTGDDSYIYIYIYDTLAPTSDHRAFSCGSLADRLATADSSNYDTVRVFHIPRYVGVGPVAALYFIYGFKHK